jgi:beta-aspartyl-peptidase (threonine type)
MKVAKLNISTCSGAVGAVKHVAHPISLARTIMENSNHVLLVGEGAESFAKSHGYELVENETLVSARARIVLDKVMNQSLGPTTETGSAPPPMGPSALPPQEYSKYTIIYNRL